MIILIGGKDEDWNDQIKEMMRMTILTRMTFSSRVFLK
jgi:hypothetical protein